VLIVAEVDAHGSLLIVQHDVRTVAIGEETDGGLVFVVLDAQGAAGEV
jgi:hypothetical protein